MLLISQRFAQIGIVLSISCLRRRHLWPLKIVGKAIPN